MRTRDNGREGGGAFPLGSGADSVIIPFKVERMLDGPVHDSVKSLQGMHTRPPTLVAAYIIAGNCPSHGVAMGSSSLQKLILSKWQQDKKGTPMTTDAVYAFHFVAICPSPLLPVSAIVISRDKTVHSAREIHAHKTCHIIRASPHLETQITHHLKDPNWRMCFTRRKPPLSSVSSFNLALYRALLYLGLYRVVTADLVVHVANLRTELIS